MRAFILGVATLIFAVAAMGMGSAPAFSQAGYDRPGGDYAGAPVINGDPAVCAARCEHDGNCRAWNFVYPTAGQPAMCWLKHQVTPRVRSSCCVSGVRGGGIVEPLFDEFEFSIDRAGGDYKSFDTLPDPRGWPCASACRADAHCRAWTYRRLGYGTANARCYLKDAITPPRARPCCISGVVR